jgi:hypothetical protein
MEASSKRRGRLTLLVAVAIAMAWPPIYSLFVHPVLAPVVGYSHASTSDLQRLLGAQRYTLRVPTECNGWLLSFESVVDGEAKLSGGSTVSADSEITLLVRRTRDTKRIEYCWFTENQLARGLLDDPIADAGVTSHREPGTVSSGDWLFRGGRQSLKHAPEAGADFEVRVVLRPPGRENDV